MAKSSLCMGQPRRQISPNGNVRFSALKQLKRARFREQTGVTIVPSWGTNGLLLFAASGADTGLNLRIHGVAPSSSKRLFDSTPLYRSKFSTTPAEVKNL